MSGMIEVARATVTIVPNMQGAQQKITQEMTGAAAPAGIEAGKAAGKNMASAIGGKLTDVGKSLTKNVTVPMMAVGAASVAAWKSVDAGMDIVVQKTGATGSALTAMQTSVKNLATTIPTSFEEAGSAIGEVNTRFGLTGQALEDLSAQFIKFAQLNGTDVSSSIDSVQRAMTAFGVSASDAGGMLDVMNAVGQQTGIDMDTLAQSMASNAATMQEMGLNAVQAAQFLGAVEVSGMDVSASMMGLKTAMKNAAEDGLTLDAALAQWDETMKSNASDTDKLNASIELFGSKAGAQFYNAAQQGTLSLEGLSGEMSNFSGSVSSTFSETQDPMDNFQTVMNQLKITGASLVETVGPMLSSALSTVSDVLGKIQAAWDGLSPGAQDAIVKVGLVVAAIGPLLTLIGNVISIAPMVSSAFAMVNASLGPIGWIIAAVVAAGILLVANWDTIKEWAAKLWEGIKAAWDNIKQGAADLWSGVTEKWNAIKDSISGAWDSVKEKTSEAWGAVKSKIEEHGGGIKGVIGTAVEGYCSIWKTGFNVIDNLTGGKLGNMLSTVTGKVDEIRGKMSEGWENIKSKTSEAWGNIQSSVESHGGGIRGIIGTAVDGYKSIWTTGFNAIDSVTGGKLSSALSTVQSKVESIRAAFADKLGAARDKVKQIIDKIKSFFNFSWSLPQLKLPHVSITGKFSLNPPQAPSFSISWYAKAMQNAMLLNSPTIFGAAGGKLLGAGEAGPEVVAGASKLMSMISSSVRAEMIRSKQAGAASKVVINVYGAEGQPISEIADEVARRLYFQTRKKVFA